MQEVATPLGVGFKAEIQLALKIGLNGLKFLKCNRFFASPNQLMVDLSNAFLYFIGATLQIGLHNSWIKMGVLRGAKTQVIDKPLLIAQNLRKS